jgi:uncharacterized protein YggE
MSSHHLIVALVFFSASVASAQTQHANSDQKTIEISATERVQAKAEIAIIKLGFQNEAATKGAAYAENTSSANKILAALLQAGVPTEAIETETLNLGQDQERYGPNSNRSTKFTATQQWQIQCKASDAQQIVDIAVAAGANQVEPVDWSVADDKGLEAKAYAAALERAKELARQTAMLSGVKLGELVSIVNAANETRRFGRTDGRGLQMYAKVLAPRVAMLKLQPAMVQREASVTVVFAIAP